ncbi:DUF58 domain-containing protein [Agromyces sp. SYSU T0242]|uniref:DUF58 domain-containing protein n=1 Tax=Agromyces litoreus TaxID=3158561 RepID=UPI00339863DD
MSRSRRPRRAARPRLTTRGIALLAMGGVLFAVALWFELRDILLLAAVGLAMPLVALGYLAVRPPVLVVRRTFEPPVIGAGHSATVRLRVRNRSRRPFDGAHWRDLAEAPLRTPPEAILPDIGRNEVLMREGDDEVGLEYRIRTPRRGVFEVGPLRVSVIDPFGLTRMDRVAGTARELVVTPRVTPLEPAVGLVASVDGAVRALQRRTHPNSDELIAREYRYGDPLRRIHWAATARRGELMVREEEQRGDPEVRVLLDTVLGGRAHVPGAGHGRDAGEAVDPAFEFGVEMAASIGVHLLARGFRVRIDPIEDPGAEVRPVSPEAGGYRSAGGDVALLEDLARLDSPGRVRGGDAGAPWMPATTAAAARRDARMPAVAVIVDPSGPATEGLVALRTSVEPAIAFAAETVSPAVVHRLEEADWRVVRVRRPADLPAAWQDAWRSARESARAGGDGGA